MSRAPGYTLLELLLVLLLISLIAGVAYPALQKLYASVTRAVAADQILEAISSLGYKAYREGREIALSREPTADELAALQVELPEDWYLAFDEPLRFTRNGICHGSVLELRDGQAVRRYRLEPPHCLPQPTQ